MNIRTITVAAIASLSLACTGLGYSLPAPTVLTVKNGLSGDYFGSAVDCFDQTLAGAASGVQNNRGSVFIFTFTAGFPGSWNQTTELVPSDATSQTGFGNAVAVHGSGSEGGRICVVGAPTGQSGKGSVYIYTSNDSGVWTQVDEILLDNGVDGDKFGNSIDIDEDTILIGAPGVDSSIGRAYTYDYSTQSDGGFQISPTQEISATGSPESGDSFGSSVAISGANCLVGAAGTSSNTGSAYLFTEEESTVWKQNHIFVAPDGVAGDAFGSSVAMRLGFSGVEPVLAVIGAPQTNSSAGSAYAFDYIDEWDTGTKLSVSDSSPDDFFGVSVSCSTNFILIGAPSLLDGTLGSAYIYQNSGFFAEIKGKPQAENDILGFSVVATGVASIFGAPGTDSNKGCIYIQAPEGNSGDVDGDGDVDRDDLEQLHATLGIRKTDVNHDCIVDVNDLLLLIQDWNETCAP